MQLSNFEYKLPQELISQKAIEPRDSCKLMVLNKAVDSINHHIFSDLLSILDTNTVLVLNNTKVFPARLFGKKETGGKAEVLLLNRLSPDSFTCLVRGKTKNNQRILFSDVLTGEIVKGEEEIKIVFNIANNELLNEIDKIGITPLPPYIHSEESETNLRSQYQTVYAKEKGSAAAPTAGLHFTDNLLETLKNKGVQIEYVTLHVGLGTFKPVTVSQVENRVLHKERFSISESTAKSLNQAKSEGKRIVAVGTTTCRLLESQSSEDGVLSYGEGETDIFIQPGYKFKFVDGLITNFHLPSTSLLMLVTALSTFPNSEKPFKDFQNSLIGRAYEEAVKRKYQFFSFGDAMLVL